MCACVCVWGGVGVGVCGCACVCVCVCVCAQIKAGRCLIQCPIHSRHPLNVSCHLSLSYAGDKWDSSWSGALALTIYLVLALRGEPSESRGAAQGLLWPGSARTSSSVSVALTTEGARVQKRPAFLPGSWKSSISALRPPPFF